MGSVSAVTRTVRPDAALASTTCADSARAGAAVLRRGLLGALAVDVERQQVAGLVGLGEVAHDRAGDRPARAEHRDVQSAAHSASSRPRSASQNSIRSRGLPSERPVSSSTRLIR
jgi:hypothetical protein